MDSREAHQAGRQRRRQKRRRRGRVAVKGLVMGAMIFGAQAKPKANHKHKEAGIATAEVHVSMDSFAAIPAYLAYDDIIDEAASKFDLDADLIHAVIQTESGYNALAESPVGAQGLMQLMPALQTDMDVADPFDPRENIMAGSEYLKRLLNRHDGNVALALASYNAGPRNVTRYKGVPPFKETRDYVKKVKGILEDLAD